MNRKPILIALFLLFLFNAAPVIAQTTGFTYQGKLTNNTGNPLSGQYDFQFKLFDTDGTGLPGTQQGTTQTATNITVTNGIFTVQLDFGACASCFNGAARFLEIAVRVAGGGSYTTLAPRQPITATPYAIKSMNSTTADGLSLTCVSCVTSSQIASVSGSAVTGTIPVASVPAGSANYIHNTTSQQESSNFNISGNGAVGGNFGVGTSSPADKVQIISGTTDIRFGTPNGADGMEIRSNAVGHSPAIYLNHTGNQGRTYRIASYGDNTNPGSLVIRDDSGGGDRLILDKDGNFQFNLGTTSLPDDSGALSFKVAGRFSGISIEAGGLRANFGTNTGREATFHPGRNGFWLRTDNDFSTGGFHFFKKESISGTESELLTINDSGNVGIGTTAPSQRLHVVGNEILSTGSGAGFKFRDRSSSSPNDDWVWYSSSNLARFFRAGVGDLLTITTTGVITLSGLGAAGSTHLCRNGSNQISDCSSSLRYKSNIASLHTGLSLINRLRPVTFDWKQNGEPDLGLVAEEVAKAEPLLVTHNEKGEIEGVKYDRLGVVLINVVKEQQAQIEEQRRQASRQAEQIKAQQKEIAALKKLVCLDHPEAEMCKP
jgi:hypothetical protein